MIELYNIGIDEKDLKEMVNINPDILSLDSEEIKEMINILKMVECNERQIKDILYANPFYLSRVKSDVLSLCKKLKEIGITDLNLFFDSNAFFLNKDVFEIDDYINSELSKGISIEEIVDNLESNPYIIDEII